MLVLSLQSQLVYGYAGNSAAVPVLQAAGLTVLPVPTTLLSNTPHYPDFTRAPIGAKEVGDLLSGIMQRVQPSDITAVLTGWMGSAEIVHTTAAFIRELKAKHPGVLYLCDPVMGDAKSGLYVNPACAEAIAEALVPLADILTPNTFELDRLQGTEPASIVARLRALSGPANRPVVVSSVPAEDGTVANVAGTAKGEVWRVRTPLLSPALTGTGDVMTARFLAAWLEGESLANALALGVGGIFAVIEAAEQRGAPEMPLTQVMRQVLAPSRRFVPERWTDEA